MSDAAAPRDDATQRVMALIARRDAARHDPRRHSPWPWVRTRADAAFFRYEDALRGATFSRREQLIDEAIARARRGRVGVSVQTWQQPSSACIANELLKLRSHLPITDDDIIERLFKDARLRRVEDDVRNADRAASRIPLDDYNRALELIDFIGRPHRNGGASTDARDGELTAFITSEACRLPQPVTVWRGELPSSEFPDFADETLHARPGDVISRSHGAISATFAPDVAARREFSGTPLAHSGARATGWILQIRTDQLLFTASREARRNITDGLAVDEMEAVIVAPELRVVRHFEALIDSEWGFKRAHVIECAPL